MFDITKEIQPVTTFRRKPAQFLKQIRKSKRPIVLTVNGKAAAVIQDAEAYQRLLDLAAEADVFEAVRQATEDIARGRTRPVREAFAELRRRHGLPSRDL